MPENLPIVRFLGLAAKRPRWGLTWRGRLAVLAVGLGLATIFVLRIHPFLALSQPVATRVMVVEGWISLPSIRAAAETFRSGGYERLYTVGGPFPNSVASTGKSYAEVTADQFCEMGIPREVVEAVSAGNAQRDRTYSSAVALREYFKAHGQSVVGINVVTEGAHSRRSRLMFEAAFGDAVPIGVLSIPVDEYDTARWWQYSEGVKDVISEGAAYCYARFLFQAE
jgi:hypothetical protein